MQYVLLPGLDGIGKLMEPFADALADHGLANAKDIVIVRYPDTVLDQFMALEHVRSILPQQPFVMIAESFSGAVAALLATENPKHLKALVFVATFATRPQPVPVGLVKLLSKAPLANANTLNALMPFLIGKWGSKAFLAQFADAVADVPIQSMLARLQAVQALDVRHCLADVTQPALYLQASHDRLVPARHGQSFRDHIPHLQFERLDGPHFLLETQPEICAQHVGRFLESL